MGGKINKRHRVLEQRAGECKKGVKRRETKSSTAWGRGNEETCSCGGMKNEKKGSRRAEMAGSLSSLAPRTKWQSVRCGGRVDGHGWPSSAWGGGTRALIGSRLPTPRTLLAVPALALSRSAHAIRYGRLASHQSQSQWLAH